MKGKFLGILGVGCVVVAFSMMTNISAVKDYFIRSAFADIYIKYFRDGKDIDADHLISSLDDGTPIVVNKHDRCVCWFVRLVGHWDSNETRVLEKLVKKNFNIIEVGANFGVHTLRMAKMVGPQGKVYAFEANPAVSKYLKMSIGMNQLGSVISVYEKVAGDIKGETYLTFGELNIGGGHLVSSPDSQSVKIQIVQLDDEIGRQKIDLLKIDAEGCEGKIIAGAKRLIEDNPDIILMIKWIHQHLQNQGTDPNALADIFKRNGFKVWRVGKKSAGEPLLVPISCDDLKVLAVGDVVLSRNEMKL
jgi:FkbM family methyltransferase